MKNLGSGHLKSIKLRLEYETDVGISKFGHKMLHFNRSEVVYILH